MEKPQLFLFHFAGGNCYSFQFLQPYLRDIEFIPLELPGRGKRITEPLLKNFDKAAHDMYQQVSLRLNGKKFLFYGHSMGALLSLKVAGALEQKNIFPKSLVVSGNPGPDYRHTVKKYLLSKTDLIGELRKMGGTSKEVLANEELIDFFEPLIRADFEIAENYEGINFPPVRSPIFALSGDKEDFGDDILNWANYTLSDLKTELFRGDHFFIHDHAFRISQILNDCFSGSFSNSTHEGWKL